MVTMEAELPVQYRSERFFEVLRNHSRDKEDPVSEWDFVEVLDNDGATNCICTAQIRYLYKIENRCTKDTLIVGSECIKRWLHGLLRCHRCNCRLGNIVKRLRDENFHCRECRKIVDKEFQERVNSKLGKLRLFWYGPYYQKEFREVINDIPYVEKLLNVTKKTQTLELFEKYASSVYEIKLEPASPSSS